MSPEVDPSLLQDFLTETSELIGQLDVDLVKLEAAPDGAESRELLNGVFRALHTVKGAAGFLGLAALIRFAHAAEDALNRLRKGEVAVSAEVIDSLLQSVDVLRNMTAALAAGQEIPECPDELIARLHHIAEGSIPAPSGEPATGSEAPINTENTPASTTLRAVPNDCIQGQLRPLNLPASKRELVSYLASDLIDSAQRIQKHLTDALTKDLRAASSAALAELAQSTADGVDFFEMTDLGDLLRATGDAARALPQLPDPTVEELLTLLATVPRLLDQQASAPRLDTVMSLALASWAERIRELSTNQSPADPAKTVAANPLPAERRESDDRRQRDRRTDEQATAPTDSTIRVEVARLEALLDLVGQLVLTKNRLMGLARKIRSHQLPHEIVEQVGSASNELDRLTGSLQVGVMRTRMQPMAKLFDRYPRVIRDVARATQKQIELKIEGKETEVDKGVLELLGDPLIHILRNSADHGIESPEVRKANGKPEVGTIHLRAEHQGSHVRVEIRDDGKGLDRELIARKAVEKGLATAEQVASMSESQVFQFIFAAGVSTAEKVSDLSGRGVGMDVVRTNVARMGGLVNLSSVKNQGTVVEVIIPLTVAIMPAMVVGVGRHLYAVPLTSITEIVRPQPSEMHTVNGQAVMRLRDGVLPLIDLRARLGEDTNASASGFVVIVRVGSQGVGLVVDRLIGQQEVVIKPLDDKYAVGGPFSGATIREDGGVSLILDVVQLIRDADGRQADRLEAA